MGGRRHISESAVAFAILHRATCLWLELYVCVRVPIHPLIFYRYPAIVLLNVGLESMLDRIPVCNDVTTSWLPAPPSQSTTVVPVCHARSERKQTTVLPLESQAKLLERALPLDLDVLIIARYVWPGCTVT